MPIWLDEESDLESPFNRPLALKEFFFELFIQSISKNNKVQVIQFVSFTFHTNYPNYPTTSSFSLFLSLSLFLSCSYFTSLQIHSWKWVYLRLSLSMGRLSVMSSFSPHLQMKVDLFPVSMWIHLSSCTSSPLWLPKSQDQKT